MNAVNTDGDKLTELVCHSLDDLNKVATRLINQFPDNRIFAFYGEMGAGKTTFIKTICDVLNVDDIASSPTFSLVNVYNRIDNNPVYHFDFYRVKTIEEVYDIGYEDYFFSGQYCFIEWPEMIDSLLPDNVVNVYIDAEEGSSNRVIRF